MAFFQAILNDKKQNGGTAIDNADFTIPDIRLSGKYVLFWRAIEGRPVEVLRRCRLPHKVEDIIKYFRTNIDRYDDMYENINLLIPEYQDMIAMPCPRPPDIQRKLTSFTTHTAIYDPKKHRVETIHYGTFRCLFEEIYGFAREEEVKDAILKCDLL